MNEHETFYCTLCNEEHPISEQHLFDGAELCNACFDSETTICACCGDRIWSEDAETDGRITLCQTCYDRYYTHCTNCDRLIDYDDSWLEIEQMIYDPELMDECISEVMCG